MSGRKDVWELQVWEFRFLRSFPSFPRRKSQFKKCLGKRLEVPDILLPDIRGLLISALPSDLQGDSRESVRANRFAERSYFHDVRLIPANRLKAAIRNFFAPRRDLQEKRFNLSEKSLMSVISAHTSGAGNGCANFMGAWHFWALSAGKPTRP